MKLLFIIIPFLITFSTYSATSSSNSDLENSLIKTLSTRFYKDIGCLLTTTKCEKGLRTLSEITDKKSIEMIKNIGADDIVINDSSFINSIVVHDEITIYLLSTSSKQQMLKFLAKQPTKLSESTKNTRILIKRKFKLIKEIGEMTGIDNDNFCTLVNNINDCINMLFKIKEVIKDTNIATKTIDDIYIVQDNSSKYYTDTARGMITGDSFSISIPTSYTALQIKEYIESLPDEGTKEYYEKIEKKTTSGLKLRMKYIERTYNVEIELYLGSQNNKELSRALDNLESFFSKEILKDISIEHILLSFYSTNLEITNDKIGIVLDINLSKEKMLEHLLSQPRIGSDEIQYLKNMQEEKLLLINYFNSNLGIEVGCSMVNNQDCIEGLSILKEVALIKKETVTKFQVITISDTLGKSTFIKGVNKVQVAKYMTVDELAQYLNEQKVEVVKLGIVQRIKNLFK